MHNRIPRSRQSCPKVPNRIPRSRQSCPKVPKIIPRSHRTCPKVPNTVQGRAEVAQTCPTPHRGCPKVPKRSRHSCPKVLTTFQGRARVAQKCTAEFEGRAEVAQKCTTEFQGRALTRAALAALAFARAAVGLRCRRRIREGGCGGPPCEGGGWHSRDRHCEGGGRKGAALAFARAVVECCLGTARAVVKGLPPCWHSRGRHCEGGGRRGAALACARAVVERRHRAARAVVTWLLLAKDFHNFPKPILAQSSISRSRPPASPHAFIRKTNGRFHTHSTTLPPHPFVRTASSCWTS